MSTAGTKNAGGERIREDLLDSPSDAGSLPPEISLWPKQDAAPYFAPLVQQVEHDLVPHIDHTGAEVAAVQDPGIPATPEVAVVRIVPHLQRAVSAVRLPHLLACMPHIS